MCKILAIFKSEINQLSKVVFGKNTKDRPLKNALVEIKACDKFVKIQANVKGVFDERDHSRSCLVKSISMSINWVEKSCSCP